MSRREVTIEELSPVLIFSRRGTGTDKFVQLCIQDTREGALSIKNLTPKQARRLAAKLLVDSEMGDD